MVSTSNRVYWGKAWATAPTPKRRTQVKPGDALKHVKVMPLDQGGHEQGTTIIQNILTDWDVDNNIITIIKILFIELTVSQMLVNNTN